VLESDVGDAPMVLGGDGDHDEMQGSEGSSGAWSARPIASWNCDKERPEDAQTPVAFSLLWGGRVTAEKFKPSSSRGAPEREESRSTKFRLQSHLLPSKSTDHRGGIVGCCGLRREIARPGGVSGTGGKRGKERGPRAFYRRRQGRS
jgi:hypothetical protein